MRQKFIPRDEKKEKLKLNRIIATQNSAQKEIQKKEEELFACNESTAIAEDNLEYAKKELSKKELEISGKEKDLEKIKQDILDEENKAQKNKESIEEEISGLESTKQELFNEIEIAGEGFAKLLIDEKKDKLKKEKALANLDKTLAKKEVEKNSLIIQIDDYKIDLAGLKSSVKEKEAIEEEISSKITDLEFSESKVEEEIDGKNEALAGIQREIDNSNIEFGTSVTKLEEIKKSQEAEEKKLDAMKRYRVNLARKGKELRKLYDYIIDVYKEANVKMKKTNFDLVIPEEE